MSKASRNIRIGNPDGDITIVFLSVESLSSLSESTLVFNVNPDENGAAAAFVDSARNLKHQTAKTTVSHLMNANNHFAKQSLSSIYYHHHAKNHHAAHTN